MKFAREAKAGRVTLAKKDARLAYLTPSYRQGIPYKDAWSIDRAIDGGMNKVIWVFRSVHAIADNQARLPVEIAQDAEDGVAIPTHPLVSLLNQAPNPDESAYSIRYRLSSTVLLSKKGAFVEWVRAKGSNNIVQMYLLDPRKTFPVPGSDRLIESYAVDIGYGRWQFLDPADVSWIKLPHPVDPLNGMTPMEAAGLSIDTDILGRLYNRTFLQNDGRPGGIVGIKGDMDDDVRDELDERWNAGTKGAGRISVVEADGLDFVDTAVTPRDAQYVEGRKMNKEDILGGFGVPESVALANASGRTFDNADAEEGIFWKSTMLGHLALLGDGFNKADDDPSTFVRFDLTNVEPLQRGEIARRAEMREEVKSGTRTLDSYLEETGRPPVGSPEARSYYRATGDVPIATEGEPAPVVSLIQNVANQAAKAAVAEMGRR